MIVTPRCSVNDRILEWPFTRRCDRDATRVVHVAYPQEAGYDKIFTETILLCDHHRAQAKQAEIILGDEPVERSDTDG